MRLTQRMRDAFVRDVIRDVPQTDYKSLYQKALRDEGMKSLPKEVLAIYMDKELRGYIKCDRQFYGTWECAIAAASGYKQSEALLEKKKGWEKSWEEQDKVLRELRAKLNGIAQACTTTDALRKALPELANYVPKDEVTKKGLPATTGLITDLMRAGWPKGKAA